MVEVLDAGLDFFLQILHQFVRFLGIELGNADHAYLKQFLDIFVAHLTDKQVLERRQRLIDKLNQFLFVRRILVAFLFVDTVFDEDFLQRGIEIFLLEFTLLDLQFPFEQRFGVLAGKFEQVGDRGKYRFPVLYHAAVGRDIDFAIGERIEGVYRLVGRRTRC